VQRVDRAAAVIGAERQRDPRIEQEPAAGDSQVAVDARRGEHMAVAGQEAGLVGDRRAGGGDLLGAGGVEQQQMVDGGRIRRRTDIGQHARGLAAGEVAERVDAQPHTGFDVLADQGGQLGVGVAQVRGGQVAGAEGQLAAERLTQRPSGAQPPRLADRTAEHAG
jgi:hypothetical protein